MQDQDNYISNEKKKVFSCKALSIIKEQKEKKTRKWKDTNKNNEQFIFCLPKIPLKFQSMALLLLSVLNNCASSGKYIQLDPKQL